jgi:hypothetical protein
MPFLKLRYLIALLLNVIFLNSVSAQDSLDHSRDFVGYKAIISNEDGFIAVGSDGRIDRIAVSGSIVKSDQLSGESFNSVLFDGKRIIVAGEHGTMLNSSDNGAFQRIKSGTDNNINSLALFKGFIIAGADNGEILYSDGSGSFSKNYPAVKGNIVSLSARDSDCLGATNEGEIIHSKDGIKWDVFDFNEVYAGYYKPCYFTKILATDMQIAVAGIHDDGTPVLMFSNQGNVWSERILVYSDELGGQGILNDRPNDIYYDQSLDMFYLACNKGKVMQIPSCSHCNKLAQFSEINISGISGNDKTLLIVGENFFKKAISAE